MSVLTSNMSEELFLRVDHAIQSNLGTREVCDGSTLKLQCKSDNVTQDNMTIT